MNLTQAQQIAMNMLSKENLGVFTLSGLDVNEDRGSNNKIDVVFML